MRLRQDAGHPVSDFERYTYRSQNGERVTSVLGVMDKPALRYWYSKMTAADALPRLSKSAIQALLDEATAAHETTKYHLERHRKVCDFVPDALKWLAGAPMRTRDEAADRGGAVHGSAEKDAEFADVALSAYEQYRQWVADYRPNIIVRERRVFDPEHGYGGTFDLIAEVAGKVYLIDLKTSRYTYHETRLQLAAYLYAELCVDGDVIDMPATYARNRVEACAILHLTDDGYEFLEVEVGDAEWDWFCYLVALHPFYKLANSRPPKPVGRPIPRPAEAAA